MSLDYVDIFYSHRVDEVTPIEETVGALDAVVHSGEGTLRRDLVVLGGAHGRRSTLSPPHLGTPLVIHQPSYSILNRWVEDGLHGGATTETGLGAIAFVPLAQGLLTDKYLGDGPAERAHDPAVVAEPSGEARKRCPPACTPLNEIAARTRSDPRPDVAGVGAQQPGDHVCAHRCVASRAARREPRRARRAGLRRPRTGRGSIALDRRVPDAQHLGRLVRQMIERSGAVGGSANLEG